MGKSFKYRGYSHRSSALKTLTSAINRQNPRKIQEKIALERFKRVSLVRSQIKRFFRNLRQYFVIT